MKIDIIKISASPSVSLLVWISAFLLGVVLATICVPVSVFDWALPITIGSFLLAISAGIIIKNKKAQLFVVAGSLFLAGIGRYLASSDDSVDLLALLPALIAIKAWLIGAVGKMLVQPQAGFLDGLLVGGGARSSDLREAFIATGTAHIMALSGWNIMIINKWIGNGLLFLRFKKKARWVLLVLIIIAFVIMTGAGASLVRASAMALIVTIAAASGRRSAPGRAVIYTAAVMLLVTPRIIATDIGFLLSISATMGMVYLSPFFKPFVKNFPNILNLPETIAGTLGATLATLPVTLVAFGQTSLVALPANIFLLPFIAPTMAVGFVCAIVSSLAPALTGICGWITSVFITYDISVVKLFARVPNASLVGLSFNWVASVVMSAGMIWVVYKNRAIILEKKN